MNLMRDLLVDGGVAVGTAGGLGSEVPFLADAGFDFLIFDTQHSPVEIKQLAGPIASIRRRHATPIVRVGDNNAEQICYALDQGAKGIIAPMVNTPEQAEDMVQSCKYPMEGVRSNAGPRGEWGEFKSYREYMDIVNRDMLIIPMVETQEAMDNLEAIVKTPGVNCCLIGPSDLSINLDVPLDYTNQKYLDALDRVGSTCRENDVAPGMYFVPPGIEPSVLIEKGFQFFTLAWNGWAKEGIQKGIASIR